MYTEQHTERVAGYAVAIGRLLGRPDEELKTLSLDSYHGKRNVMLQRGIGAEGVLPGRR
jgi:hypothetical protein